MTQYLRRLGKPSAGQSKAAGFTLTEGLVVAVIVGLLLAIAAPSFFGFLQQRKINIARDMVYQALRVTQTDAMQQRHDRRFSIRERNGQIEWANHADTTLATQVPAWQPLVEGVVLANIDNTLAASGGIHYVKFDMYGNIKGQLGTVTVAMSGPNITHRCVVASTMLGAMRKGKGYTRANDNGRFCY
ncbi:prepilin-type N-terminal cleavage/methylation domain-containing protein [Nodosilinea sp. LEGE 06152]|uniref:pilus assembly FimT family protein n=1 Tax=Nodosilinea sp. LEGE 06152 TaxID=2777966 RepID=UPI0018801C17|nr:prepilin-type N-terminal cleavage/methylation domain-containing protein [Nodosilinea sp. LEGE 06152]MBE9160686.1 prepilin-type N-terminal cleavage/methylation domain-containing protein [Nodosilinea sp. LEGE 06152]